MQFIILKRLMPPVVRRQLRTSWNRVLEREQIWREKRFYRQFVHERDLVFDIGAHVGIKTAAFLSLGARVVAVEPNPVCSAEIAARCRSALEKQVLHIETLAAAGPDGGRVDLCVFDSHADLTSGSAEFARHARQLSKESGRMIQVDSVSLNDLIARFGVPKFLKIDVEGMDAEVLGGLTYRPQFLSFEYNTDANLWQNTLGCFSEVMRLGFNEANMTKFANPELTLRQWVEIRKAPSEIQRACGPNDWGDIVVR
jgi:FkbM family methyltransferase